MFVQMAMIGLGLLVGTCSCSDLRLSSLLTCCFEHNWRLLWSACSLALQNLADTKHSRLARDSYCHMCRHVQLHWLLVVL